MWPNAKTFIELPVHISSFGNEKLNRTQVTGSSRLHQWSSTSLRSVFQIGTILQKNLGHISVSILAGVRQRRVSSARLCVHIGAGFQQIANLKKHTINQLLFSIFNQVFNTSNL